MENREMINENKTDAKQRKIGIDVLRFICAFLVVCVHVSFVGKKHLLVLTRIAVPIFFMIMGYFFVNLGKERQIKQIKRIGLLTLFSTLFYFVFNLMISLIEGSSAEYLSSFINVKTIIDLIIFNDNPASTHLWFLLAMLYSLLFFYLIKPKIKTKLAIPMSLSIIILGVALNFLGFYYINGWNACFTRNFIFIGIPFMMLGACFSICDFKLKNKIAIPLCIVLTMLSLIEGYIVSKQDIALEIYISITFLSILLFCIFVNGSFSSKFSKKLGNLGKKYSLMIYIIQYAFIFLLNLILTKLSGVANSTFLITLCNIFNAIAPLIVFAFSLVFSVLWVFVTDKIKVSISSKK